MESGVQGVAPISRCSALGKLCRVKARCLGIQQELQTQKFKIKIKLKKAKGGFYWNPGVANPTVWGLLTCPSPYSLPSPVLALHLLGLVRQVKGILRPCTVFSADRGCRAIRCPVYSFDRIAALLCIILPVCLFKLPPFPPCRALLPPPPLLSSPV